MGFLGAHGEFTPDYLASQGDRLEVSERRRCRTSISGVRSELIGRIVGTPRLGDQVSGWMQELSPGVRISASRLGATDLVSLRFQYASTEIGRDSKFRRPANVGFGLTYSLPIVTALLASPPGTLLLLENPEAHLHPRAQAALGTLIARVAADGVQVLVETHSDHVLNGIRLAVKSGLINSKDCQLCNFVRETETATSYIEAPVILPNGELSTWPDGFFDEWEKSLQALLA
jgi:predicted ATPase